MELEDVEKGKKENYIEETTLERTIDTPTRTTGIHEAESLQGKADVTTLQISSNETSSAEFNQSGRSQVNPMWLVKRDLNEISQEKHDRRTTHRANRTSQINKTSRVSRENEFSPAEKPLGKHTRRLSQHDDGMAY